MDREERETEFRDGRLAALYCSPTMELGVDIFDLAAVHMRNAPPLLPTMHNGVAVPVEAGDRRWS
jgi:Lhr-like helicase